MVNDKQKIENCMNTWGVNEEYATRIFKESEDLLTFEELKMKYNNPNLGVVYPDWLSPVDHLKICYQTAKEAYATSKFDWICEKQELVNMLFIWSSLRLPRFENHAVLKCACARACKNILRDNIIHLKYKGGSLENEWYSRLNDNKFIDFHSIVSTNDDSTATTNLLCSIKSLKNKTVKGLLIVCGYVIAGIDDFEQAFYDYVKTCDVPTQEKLLDLLAKVEIYDATVMDRHFNGNKDSKAKKVTIKNVMEVLGIQPQYYLPFKKFTKDYLNKREVLN